MSDLTWNKNQSPETSVGIKVAYQSNCDQNGENCDIPIGVGSIICDPNNDADCFQYEEVESCIGDCTRYRGVQDKTILGKTCQAWDAQTPNKHEHTSTNYPDA